MLNLARFLSLKKFNIHSSQQYKMVRYLAKGIEEGGRSAAYKRRRAWAVKKKNKGKFPQHPKQAKMEEAVKESKYYPADDVKTPLSRRIIRRPTKLRSSITPGTVLILLAGRFKGKRVVFLKQLESGLLLVAGPYSVNGVPARRVNQAYVIATSAKITLPKLDLASFSDSFFKKVEKKKKKSTEEEYFQEEETKKALTPEYINAQKKLDGALVGALQGDQKGYLGSMFTLRDGDKPHLMLF